MFQIQSMDEFDVYLARAYGGGQLSPSRQQADTTTQSNLHPGHKPGRRHSSVGVRCSTEFNELTSRSEYDDRKPEKTGNGAARRKLTSNVTVEVEPPSPTELLHSHPLGGVVHRKQSTSKQNGVQQNGCEPEAANAYDDDDVGDRKQFSRSRTAPVQRRGTSPTRNASTSGRRRIADGSDGDRTSSAAAASGVNQKSKDSGAVTAVVASAATRPDKLLLAAADGLPTVTIGGASPGMSRRRSTSGMQEEQRLAVGGHPSPGTLRRNSCAGPPASTSLSTGGLRLPQGSGGTLSSASSTSSTAGLGLGPTASPSSRSGRRNSAITYLTGSTSGLLAAPGRCSPRPSGPGSARPDERRSFSADGAIVDPVQLQALLRLAARSGGGCDEPGGELSPTESGQVRRSGSTAVCSLQSITERHVCRVAVLGAHEVGKSTLTSQLLTSEYLANKENYQGEKMLLLLLGLLLTSRLLAGSRCDVTNSL